MLLRAMSVTKGEMVSLINKCEKKDRQIMALQIEVNTLAREKEQLFEMLQAHQQQKRVKKE